MREPLRVAPSYYIPVVENVSKFADAVMEVGPSPCVFHKCDRYEACKDEKVECFAFRTWVNNGEPYLTEKNKKGDKIKCVEKMGRNLEPIK